MTPRRAKAIAVECRYCHGKGYREGVDGQLLRAAREDRRLSLREVARRVKISAAYLSDIELGRRQPSRAVMMDLLKAVE